MSILSRSEDIQMVRALMVRVALVFFAAVLFLSIAALAHADGIKNTQINAGQIATVTSGTAPSSGQIGQVISSSVPNSTTNVTPTSTAVNVTSVSLPAGSWQCSGEVDYLGGASLASTIAVAWISNVSASLPATSALTTPKTYQFISWSAGQTPTQPISTAVYDLSATTTIYLGALVAFSAGSITAGGNLVCVRKA